MFCQEVRDAIALAIFWRNSPLNDVTLRGVRLHLCDLELSEVAQNLPHSLPQMCVDSSRARAPGLAIGDPVDHVLAI